MPVSKLLGHELTAGNLMEYLVGIIGELTRTRHCE
jgi:hypothetical protein